MEQKHVIELALDLARMPALARNYGAPALPPNIIELMRIAAVLPEACEAAVAKTGEPAAVLIEAARFYLQQVLFRPDADCYRVLGIEPGASRETARKHMRWLLEWLHPDRNHDSWDAVYAERVLKAWREVSAVHGAPAQRTPSRARARASFNISGNGDSEPVWLPWIPQPVRSQSPAVRSYYGKMLIWALPTALVIIFLAMWSANVFSGLR